MSSQSLERKFADAGYVVDDDLAVAVELAVKLGRPLLLEGPAGVGKTEIARCLAEVMNTRLIRLQCYEGLDAGHAIYEWNYQHQLLSIRAHEGGPADAQALEEHIFSRKYLLERPLLAAITQDEPPVLLIDEIDRADSEFEAFLLEILADYRITIPELGTIEATSRPYVIATSNATRDLSDALRRRCLYGYIDYPDAEKERAILAARLPDLEAELADQIVGFVQSLRREDLEKVPGVAETLDWAAALMGLGMDDIGGDPDRLHASLACLLKTERDRKVITREVAARLVGKAA